MEGSSPYLEWDELELKTSQVCFVHAAQYGCKFMRGPFVLMHPSKAFLRNFSFHMIVVHHSTKVHCPNEC